MCINKQLLLKYKLAYDNIRIEVSDRYRYIEFWVKPTGDFTKVEIPYLGTDYRYDFKVNSNLPNFKSLRLDFMEGIKHINMGDILKFREAYVSIPKSATSVISNRGFTASKLTVNFNDASILVNMPSISSNRVFCTSLMFEGYKNIDCTLADAVYLLNQCIRFTDVDFLRLKDIGYRPFKLIATSTVKHLEIQPKNIGIYAPYYYVSDESLLKYLHFIASDIHNVTVDDANRFIDTNLVDEIEVRDVGIIFVENPRVTKFEGKVDGAVIIVPRGTAGYVSKRCVPRNRNIVMEV